jgi:signal transduction histidine kinase/streptogramin lyase
LHVASNGDLLIGTYKGGLTVLQGNTFRNFNHVLGEKTYSIREIAEDGHERIWISNTENDNLNVLKIGTYEHIFITEKMPTQTFTSMFNIGDLYYFPFDGGIKIRDKDIGKIPGMEDIKSLESIEGVETEGNGKHFWAIDGAQLLRYRGNTRLDAYKIPNRENYSRYVIRFIRLKELLYIQFYGNSTMVVFDTATRKFSTFEINSFCQNGTVNHMFSDRESNVWIATDICGLVKLKPSRFTYLGSQFPNLDQNIYPIKLDSLNRVLIGTRQDDLYILDDQKNTLSRPPELLGESSYVTSIESFQGAVYYAALSRNFILKWQGDKTEHIYFPDGKKQQANAIYASRRNELLVGTEEMAYWLQGDKLIPHPVNRLADTYNIINFYEDEGDNLWIVSERSVICYNADLDTILYTTPYDQNIPRFFRGIHGDSDGNIYVGSYGFGLHVISNGKLHEVGTGLGLAENVVSTITEDQSGNIWFTGNKGLSRVSKSELFEVINGDRKRFNVVLYNEESDGLRTGEFNGGIQQDKCRLDATRYVFPTLRGPVVVDFSNILFNEIKPPVHIQKLAYADTILQANNPVSVPYNDGRMDIYYTALSYVSPQNVRFRYKLDGYETHWIDAGAERKTSYSKLPPGEYTFRVIACNNEGLWNEEGASLGITIVPPYYMTWWFRMGCLLLFLGITIAVVWQIVAQNRKREKHKSALMDLLPDLVFKIDQNGNYLDIYGKPSDFPEPLENFDRKKISDFLPTQISEDARLKIVRAITTGEIQDYAYKVEQADGSSRYFESRFIALDRQSVLCIIRDITAPRLAEKQIRASERRLLEALKTEKKLLKRINEQQKIQLEAIVNTEENERKRIAKDLHDGIGQLLSSVKINLGVAKTKINDNDIKSSALLVDRSTIAIDQITSELRSISYNLLPPSLEQFGLASAIEEEVKRLNSKPNLFIHFDSSTTTQKFDQKVEIILFRVFQEMLNNALKHSEAKEITIQLIEHKKTLVLMLEDDGNGFDVEAGILKKNSSGLKNLYSRIELLKGKINIDSTPASGTTISIDIPI